MVIKHWRTKETFYWMKVNFKTATAYSDVIQITLKDPWWFPKYEDDFAGVKGLRLYGWLFFYFGRVYTGFIYPAEETDTYKKCIVDKNGKKWLYFSKENVDDFDKAVKIRKKAIMKGYKMKFERKYQGEKFDVIVKFV